MKSKITRMAPKDVGTMKFSEAKAILKKDIATLATIKEESVDFFWLTEFAYKDKQNPILVISEFKGAWKDYVKAQVKPPHKISASGQCSLSKDKKTLILNINKGKAKPNIIEKALKKSKLLPPNIKFKLNEDIKLDADEAITAMDDAVTSGSDKYYDKIVAEANSYKKIPLEDGEKRLKEIQSILKLIEKWEKEHLPIKSDDKDTEKRYAQIQKLRSQLNDHKIDIHVRSRKGEPIDPIKNSWETYQKRPVVKGIEELADLEDRMDTMTDLLEDTVGWNTRNPPKHSKSEKKLKQELDLIEKAVSNEILRLKAALPKARKANVTLMLEKISSASPQEKEKLKKDEVFMWELSRTVPTAQINNVRELLGMPPVPIEDKDVAPFPENQEAWKDPEIAAVFKDFAKFTTFDVSVDHKKDPKFKKKVKLLKGTKIWEDGKTSADNYALNKDTVFEMDSEDSKGNVKLKLVVKKVDKFYYVVKTDIASETHYEKLDPKTKLFPEPPSKNHVLQGGLGDCYLLAALTSLVNKDPQFIVDMMLDKGDTVTVRLFDVIIDKKDKQTFKAKYYNVDKSVVKTHDNTDAYARNYLWVQILEKAYAAGNFLGTFQKMKTQKKKTDPSFQDIAGGHAAFASQVLTGKAAEILIYHANSPKDFAVTDIPSTERGKITKNSKITTQKLPWGTNEQSIFSAPGKNYTKTLSYTIFGNNKTKTIEWWKFVQKGSIDMLFKREHSANYSGEVTLEDFELLFQGKMKDANDNDVKKLPVLDKGLAKTMLSWLKTKKLYPGKRGSGVYSTLQLNMFNVVKTALGNNKLVSLSSKKIVGRSNDGKGHSGGEAKSGGLVGGHAYAALDTRENAPQKEIEIKNPWGHTVQKNMTVQQAIKDVKGKLSIVTKTEVVELTPAYNKLKGNVATQKLAVDNEKDPTKKQQLNLKYKEDTKKLQKLTQHLNDLQDPTKLMTFKGKITNKYKDYYDKQVETVIPGLMKKNPTDLISIQENKSSEKKQDAGEFWLLLDDLTKRFNAIHIG